MTTSSISSTSTVVGGNSKNSVSTFPDKHRREKCKLARENYMKCLDSHYGIDAPSLDPELKCTSLFSTFESECPKIWVTHFLQKREMEIRNRKLGFTN